MKIFDSIVKSRPTLCFGVLGLFIGLCWWKISTFNDIRLNLFEFYLLFTFVFLSYLLSLRGVQILSPSQSQVREHLPSLLCIIMAAGVFRLLIIETTPTLSDDIYRYLWDGRVQMAGIDPYLYAPSDEKLTFLRNENFSFINFPDLRTVYPPITQLAFWLGVFIAENLTAQKLVFVCAEFFTAIALGAILIRKKMSLLWLTAYIWHPLAVLEIAGSGHNDALGIAFLWMGIAALQFNRKASSILAFAAAFLSKFGSIVMVPWLWFQEKTRKRLIVFFVFLVAVFLSIPNLISALQESLLGVSSIRLEANSSIYLALVKLLGGTVFAQVLVCLSGIGLLFVLAKKIDDPIHYFFISWSGIALLSPVLHPWYLLWIIPAFCFIRSWSIMTLTLTAVLAYTIWPGYLNDGVWVMPLWARLLEYVPVFALIIWEMKRWVLGSSFPLETKLSH